LNLSLATDAGVAAEITKFTTARKAVSRQHGSRRIMFRSIAVETLGPLNEALASTVCERFKFSAILPKI